MQNVTSSDSSLGKFQPEEKSHQDDKLIDKSSIDSPCSSPVAKKKKKFGNTKKKHNKSMDKIDHLADPLEYSMLESLQWRTESGFDRIFSELRTDEDCPDLLSLSKVSRIFHNEVPKFMRRGGNRPGLKEVWLKKVGDGLEAEIILFPSNLPFYDLASLDSGRFNRSIEQDEPTMLVTLIGSEDPIIEQLANLLASSIKNVIIGGPYDTRLSSSHLSLCQQLLRESTIDCLEVECVIFDDITDPIIQSIFSRVTNHLDIHLDGRPQITDPAAFINKLGSLSIGNICLSDDMSSPSSSFFGRPHSFWEKFINEKLSTRSFEWVQTGNIPFETIVEAPVDLPDTPIHWIEWRVKTN